jgi:hypothetical protein
MADVFLPHVAVAALLVVVWPAGQTTTNNAATATVMQHANRIFCAYAVLCCHPWPVWVYRTFPHSQKQHFQKEFIENTMCVF